MATDLVLFSSGFPIWKIRELEHEVPKQIFLQIRQVMEMNEGDWCYVMCLSPMTGI